MKTLIDVDEKQLAAAQQVLRTTTRKDTVNQALTEVVANAARRRDLARLHSEEAADLGDVEIMTSAWRR